MLDAASDCALIKCCQLQMGATEPQSLRVGKEVCNRTGVNSILRCPGVDSGNHRPLPRGFESRSETLMCVSVNTANLVYSEITGKPLVFLQFQHKTLALSCCIYISPSFTSSVTARAQ